MGLWFRPGCRLRRGQYQEAVDCRKVPYNQFRFAFAGRITCPAKGYQLQTNARKEREETSCGGDTTPTNGTQGAKGGEIVIEIYWDDLTKEKQDEILEALGNNGNYDVFPIAQIGVDGEDQE